MTLPKSLTTVTTFSKIIALFLFILLPLIGFFAGIQYQNMIQNSYVGDARLKIFSTQEECESFVGRKCLPTVCESDPSHASCRTNGMKGWFATRQPLGETQTFPDETASQVLNDDLASQVLNGTWKTYTNEEYGFEFKYPENYLIDDRYLQLLNENPVPNVDNYYCESEYFQSLRITGPKYDDKKYEPAIHIHLIQSKRKIDDIVKSCIATAQFSWQRDRDYGDPTVLDGLRDFEGPSLLSKETKKYKSITAEKIRELYRPDDTNVLYYFYNRDNERLFMVFADSEEEQVSDQILSTFEFIE